MNTINDRSPGIYCIENMATGKKYIGMTRNFKNRIHMHKVSLEKGSHGNKQLQLDFNNGFDFKVSIIKKFDSVDDFHIKAYEAYYIIKYNTVEDGYNIIYPGSITLIDLVRYDWFDGEDEEKYNHKVCEIVNSHTDYDLYEKIYNKKYKGIFSVVNISTLDKVAKKNNLTYLGSDTVDNIKCAFFQTEYSMYCMRIAS